MKKKTLNQLQAMKTSGEKIVTLTAYDVSHAALANENGVDVILVGDSLGNVVQGHETTAPVTMEQMVYHTSNVYRGNEHCLLMADMPYMSYATEDKTFENAALLMQAGADMVKMEGGHWLCDSIKKLTERGVPVCGHLGLTPQSVAMLGFTVQGRSEMAAEKLLEDAVLLEKSGVSLLVLECIPAPLAAEVTRVINIPTIGIGAGADTDGQILVFYDILGMTQGKTPRFVKNFMEEANSVQEAIAMYSLHVKEGIYPSTEHMYAQ